MSGKRRKNKKKLVFVKIKMKNCMEMKMPVLA
jgi:hypothetical protein